MQVMRRAAPPPSGAAPLYAFRRAPTDLDRAQSREEVRGVLGPDLLVGAAVWIDANGLHLDDVHAHTQLLRNVGRFRAGLAGLNGNPHTAVLDWSTVEATGFDALAALPVVVRTLGAQGARIILCEPWDAGVARLLEYGQLDELRGTRWVGERANSADRLLVALDTPASGVSNGGLRAIARVRSSAGSRRNPSTHRSDTNRRRSPAPRLIAPALVVGGKPSDVELEQLSGLYDATAEAVQLGIRNREDGRTLSQLVEATLRENVANACRRSDATCIGIAVGVSRGLLPTLEFAVADNGIGIAASQRRMTPALGPVPERHFVREVLRPRDPSDPRRRAGRGFVPLAHMLLARPRATVVVRSGGVLVALEGAGIRVTVVTEASAGLGTTTHVTVPLDAVGW